jgi:hypothetical protein
MPSCSSKSPYYRHACGAHENVSECKLSVLALQCVLSLLGEEILGQKINESRIDEQTGGDGVEDTDNNESKC